MLLVAVAHNLEIERIQTPHIILHVIAMHQTMCLFAANEWLHLWPIVVFALVFGLGAWIASMSEKKRTENLAKAAEELGMTFSAEPDAGLLSRLQVFATFNKGRKRKMKNVMSAETDEMRLVIFDYQYTTGGGKSSHTHKLSVAAIESESLRLPHFSIRPESIFDQIGSALGFQDIDFDEHPEFSNSFVLQGDNETAVREFFDKRVMDVFVKRKDALVEGAGNLTTYRKQGRQSAEQIADFVAEAYEFLTAFSVSDEA